MGEMREEEDEEAEEEEEEEFSLSSLAADSRGQSVCVVNS